MLTTLVLTYDIYDVTDCRLLFVKYVWIYAKNMYVTVLYVEMSAHNLSGGRL